jgi:hypothetical protein
MAGSRATLPSSWATFEPASARLAPLGRDNTDTAVTLYNNWALALNFIGQPLEAKALFEQAIRVSTADGGDKMMVIQALLGRAEAYISLGDFVHAARLHA